MNLNKFVFPAPKPTYDADLFSSELKWIPRPDNSAIPCLFLPYINGSSKTLVYFHGNAEDLGCTYRMINHIGSTLQVHVLAVEYPGYGIYPGKPTSTQIIEDADIVYHYLIKELHLRPRSLFVMGRSMGSGPATWLAANYRVGVLILMSAYTSLRSVVKNMVGRPLSYIIKNRFNNLELMHKVTCPTFFVHGKKDKLVPCKHSEQLHELCEGPSSLLIPGDMSHNDFDYFDDLSLPIALFLRECGISVAPRKNHVPVFPPGISNGT